MFPDFIKASLFQLWHHSNLFLDFANSIFHVPTRPVLCSRQIVSFCSAYTSVHTRRHTYAHTHAYTAVSSRYNQTLDYAKPIVSNIQSNRPLKSIPADEHYEDLQIIFRRRCSWSDLIKESVLSNVRDITCFYCKHLGHPMLLTIKASSLPFHYIYIT